MGTCVRNCVGRCSQLHFDDEYGTDFSQDQFAVGYKRQHCRSSDSFVQWCYSSRNLGANPTMTAGNGTGADDGNRMQVDSLKKGKGKGKGKPPTTRKEITRTAQATRAIQTSTRARTVADLNIGRKTAGDQVEEHTTIPPRKAKGKASTWTLWKRISLLKQPQPCRILHKHRVQLENSRALQTWNRGCDNQSRVNRKRSWCRVFAS